jgi:hypothetical protein
MLSFSSGRLALRRPFALGLFLLALGGGLLTTGCADALTDPVAPDDRAPLFDQLWRDFDARYSHFELKDVDWDTLRTVYRPRAAAASGDAAFFDVLAALLAELEDGHVSLYAPFATYQYRGFYEDFPRSFAPALLREYVTGGRRLSRAVESGTIAGDIGYLRVKTFAGPASDFSVVADALPSLRTRRALILDLRDNGGGSDQNARLVAQSFVREQRLVRYVKYRNGPAHDDFTALTPDYLAPGDGPAFTGPVILLTNRRCTSTCESFVLMMRPRPSTRQVGDRTGGSSGNPAMRELANGWAYRLSTWVMLTPERVPVEGRGLAPDVRVTFGADAPRDAVLERAIALLNAEGGQP